MKTLLLFSFVAFILSTTIPQKEADIIGEWVITSVAGNGKKHKYNPKPEIIFYTDETAILTTAKKKTQSWNWELKDGLISLKLIEKDKDPFFVKESFSVAIQELKNRKEMKFSAKGTIYYLRKKE